MQGATEAMHNDERELRVLYDAISNWGRWGDEDQLGTLNLITPQRVTAATRTVRDGRPVGCGAPLDVVADAANPSPPLHHMIMAGDTATTGYGQTRDFIGIAPHGPASTHLDALCHVLLDGRMYNDRPAELVASSGSRVNDLAALADGIVTRGVLLDVPALRGAEFVDPTEPVTAADLERAEEAAGVTVGPGDALLIRLGRYRRREVLGRAAERVEGRLHMAGLDPTSTLTWLRERDVALLGSDAAHDVLPARLPELRAPVHIGALVFLGLHLLDNAQLDGLAAACREAGRWEFLFALGPLVVPGGTGSPVNPVAVL
jgi:kynurenine formamidase